MIYEKWNILSIFFSINKKLYRGTGFLGFQAPLRTTTTMSLSKLLLYHHSLNEAKLI